jgi:hypothetical protein
MIAGDAFTQSFQSFGKNLQLLVGASLDNNQNLKILCVLLTTILTRATRNIHTFKIVLRRLFNW